MAVGTVLHAAMFAQSCSEKCTLSFLATQHACAVNMLMERGGLCATIQPISNHIGVDLVSCCFVSVPTDVLLNSNRILHALRIAMQIIAKVGVFAKCMFCLSASWGGRREHENNTEQLL